MICQDRMAVDKVLWRGKMEWHRLCEYIYQVVTRQEIWQKVGLPSTYTAI